MIYWTIFPFLRPQILSIWFELKEACILDLLKNRFLKRFLNLFLFLGTIMVLWPSEIKQTLLLPLNKAMMIPLILKWTFALEDEGPFAKKNMQIWVNINSYHYDQTAVSNADLGLEMNKVNKWSIWANGHLWTATFFFINGILSPKCMGILPQKISVLVLKYHL